MKRLFDLTAALLGLIVLSPFLLVTALLVKLGDFGPVFYGQQRVGRGGRPFRMWKFRSMRVGADKLGPAITIGADNRITGIGRFLRKTKADEFPQLWNVLCGEMSLVGPRPEVKRYTDLYNSDQKRVLDLVPGITDPASFAFFDESELLGRAENPEAYYVNVLMPEKIRINLEYASRRSFLKDLLIVILTVVKPFGVRINLFSALKLSPPAMLN